MQEQTPKIPLIFRERKKEWLEHHKQILEAMNKGCKTLHQIFDLTGLSYTTIYKHRKQIRKCYRCKKHIDKRKTFCPFCGFRFIETYG